MLKNAVQNWILYENKEYLMRLIKNISFSFAVERAQIVVSISDFVHLDYRRALANVPN